MKIATPKIGFDEIGLDETRAPQFGTDEIGVAGIYFVQARRQEARVGDQKWSQAGSPQVCVTELGGRKIGTP